MMMNRQWMLMSGKRAADFACAAVTLGSLWPLYAVVGAAVGHAYGRPIIFRQCRPGRNGRIFTIYKFRTMTDDVNEAGELLDDDERLTPLGSTLRRWSLDELPEFWNVVKGDMSLVGPRPLLVDYLDLYSGEQMRRHQMRPGLTGLAQVSGRNDQSWEDRLALDVWYVDNWSPWLDVKIIVRTIRKALSGDGISAPGHATMPRFEGTAVTGRKVLGQ